MNEHIKKTAKPAWVPKLWGRTRQALAKPWVEAWELEVRAGGQSSIHYHRKVNFFYLQRGKLCVELLSEGDDGTFRVLDDRVLGPGDTFQVASMKPHRFRALEECQLLEVYWAECHPDDIVRLDSPAPPMPDSIGLKTAEQLRSEIGVAADPDPSASSDSSEEGAK